MFANDALFPISPGEQTYLYVVRSADDATAFAARLNQTQHGGTYTYSPPRSGTAPADPILGPVGETEAQMYEILTRRGRAPMCTSNCITVPVAEAEAAVGFRPTTPSGVDPMTGQGPSGTVDPHHRGRARLMTEAMEQSALPEGVQRLRVTAGGGRAMFAVKSGGVVLLIYGLYHTEERVRHAVGTPELETVLGEETGSWVGGLLMGALGTAGVSALVCAPLGPVTAVCVMGGFLGGLVFGAVGSAVGSEVGHTAVRGRPPEGGILDTVSSTVTSPVRDLHNYLEYNIRQLYGLPF